MTYTLLTRCEADNQETAMMIAETGLKQDILSYPLLDIAPLDIPLPNDLTPFDSLIFTSRHGVRMIGAHPRAKELAEKDIFCVGEKTTSLAQCLSPHSVMWSENIDQLTTLLTQEKQSHKTLYFSGKDISDDLSQSVPPMHFEIIRLPIYEARLQDPLDQQFIDLYGNGNISYALFYSKRTASHFCALLDRHFGENGVLNIRDVICISDTVAGIFKAHFNQSVHIAEKPTQHAMVNCLKRLTELTN